MSEPYSDSLSEHQLLVGLISLVGALAERLTGETPIITMMKIDAEKKLVEFNPLSEFVRWVKMPAVEHAVADQAKDRPSSAGTDHVPSTPAPPLPQPHGLSASW